MWAYIARRSVLIVPTLLGVVTLVFVLIRVAPGNPIELMIPPGVSGAASVALVKKLTALYGFNRPLYIQYVDYIWQIVRLQFGTSLQTQTVILPQLLIHLWASLQLALVAFILSVVLGIPAGVVSAVRRDSIGDAGLMFVALGGISIPTFVLAYVLIFVFGVVVHALPPSGYNGSIFTPSGFRFVVLPAVTLALGTAGFIARFTRSSMLEILHTDHVRTARAKGLAEGHIVRRHVLRNSLIPILTVLGLTLGGLLGGQIVIENVFGWPGVGQYLVNAIFERDFPVVQAASISVAAAFVIMNLVTDLAYAWVDPRIRYD